jgi:hypothetical protein
VCDYIVAGVVAIQASAAGPTPPASWRIAATAVVLEQEAELRIVKKLKLVGTPLKVSVNFGVKVTVNILGSTVSTWERSWVPKGCCGVV